MLITLTLKLVKRDFEGTVLDYIKSLFVHLIIGNKQDYVLLMLLSALLVLLRHRQSQLVIDKGDSYRTDQKE